MALRLRECLPVLGRNELVLRSRACPRHYIPVSHSGSSLRRSLKAGNAWFQGVAMLPTVSASCSQRSISAADLRRAVQPRAVRRKMQSQVPRSPSPQSPPPPPYPVPQQHPSILGQTLRALVLGDMKIVSTTFGGNAPRYGMVVIEQ